MNAQDFRIVYAIGGAAYTDLDNVAPGLFLVADSREMFVLLLCLIVG